MHKNALFIFIEKLQKSPNAGGSAPRPFTPAKPHIKNSWLRHMIGHQYYRLIFDFNIAPLSLSCERKIK